MMLTACEWWDVFVDQQSQVRRGDLKNGTWHLTVERPGTYHFELRRWPRESGLALAQAVPETRVTDGVLPAGKTLPIYNARLKIGPHDIVQPSDDDGLKVSFSLELDAGDTEMQSWWLDADGKEICGAYYAYVRRE
jgi:hypothetical protein